MTPDVDGAQERRAKAADADTLFLPRQEGEDAVRAVRRDYQPGTGPSAGLVWGLLAVAPLWCLAALAVKWWW